MTPQLAHGKMSAMMVEYLSEYRPHAEVSMVTLPLVYRVLMGDWIQVRKVAKVDGLEVPIALDLNEAWWFVRAYILNGLEECTKTSPLDMTIESSAWMRQTRRKQMFTDWLAAKPPTAMQVFELVSALSVKRRISLPVLTQVVIPTLLWWKPATMDVYRSDRRLHKRLFVMEQRARDTVSDYMFNDLLNDEVLRIQQAFHNVLEDRDERLTDDNEAAANALLRTMTATASAFAFHILVRGPVNFEMAREASLCRALGSELVSKLIDNRHRPVRDQKVTRGTRRR